MNKQDAKILIFDFDGTIVDSKQVYYHAMNKYLGDYLSGKEIEKGIDIGLNVAETLKKFGFSWIENWVLKRKIMKEVLRKVNEIKKCKDAGAIKNLPGRKILISNSLIEFIMPVLKHLKIKKEFNDIYGAEDFSDKAEFISSYLRKSNINAGDCYYIGDRVADVLLAKKVGIKSIIITGKCAWDSRKEILQASPDFVIFDLKDLGDIIK